MVDDKNHVILEDGSCKNHGNECLKCRCGGLMGCSCFLLQCEQKLFWEDHKVILFKGKLYLGYSKDNGKCVHEVVEKDKLVSSKELKNVIEYLEACNTNDGHYASRMTLQKGVDVLSR